MPTSLFLKAAENRCKLAVKVYFTIAILTYFSPSSLFAQSLDQAEREKEIINAAEVWLDRVDHGEYEQSWEAGSLTLRLTVPKSRWVFLMETFRRPLGQFKNRKILTAVPAYDPTDLPKGDYYVTLFEANYTRRKTRELLTLVQESDGYWRPVTYLIE